MRVETIAERKLRMLKPLEQLCHNCTMCDLGFRMANRDNLLRPPQVFSTMNVSRFMVVGQNPGWNEVVERQPFVGDAGQNFNNEVAKHGLGRGDFYICNAVRCFTSFNAKPHPSCVASCEPYLQMEIQILNPKLIIALGALAFEQLCPGSKFHDSFGVITKSARYGGVPVFPVHHPSPLNLDEGGLRFAFERQIKMVCKLVIALREKP